MTDSPYTVESPPMNVTRPLIAAALAIASSGALAEWTELARFEDGTRIYVDRSTLRRQGDMAQVQHLVRWGEPQADPGQPPYLSTVVLMTYDCAAKRERYLGSTSHAGAMGNGITVIADRDEAQSWDSISDNSMEEQLWKAACGLD